MAELAGITAPNFVDGKSFTPLLGIDKPGVEEWRSGILIEHVTPTYQALRTSTQTYVEWPGGAKEYYDLQEDPYQLHNLFSPDQPNLPAPPDTTDLRTQLDLLSDCTSQTCRDAEQE